MVKKNNLELPVLDLVKNNRQALLPKAIFAVMVSPLLIAQYVRVYLNNLKFSTAKTKTRAEIRATTKKLYRQKGTGRARHGSKRAPIFVGGGTAHGPKNISRTLHLPKKMRRLALFATLSSKLQSGNLHLLANQLFTDIESAQKAQSIFNQISAFLKIKPEKTILVFKHNDQTKKYFRNLASLTVKEIAGLNAYEVLKAKNIFFQEEALSELSNIFLKQKK